MRRCRSWDIFCTVVDNYGDIGVSWRLARQLVREHGCAVRLWVDDLPTFQRIAPELDPARSQQVLAGVEIRQWEEPFPDTIPQDAVIEAFACHLPHAFIGAMAARSPRPVWINLEYLSAEAWVADHHTLASPHPKLPLVKHFFFPGFGHKTGGLLRENDLIQRRTAFQTDPQALAKFWASIGIPPKTNAERRVSLFAYENAAAAQLLAAWAESPSPMACVVPEGRLLPQISRFFGRATLSPGERIKRGNLTVYPIPFLPQDHYDHLLWACNFNFVRGEDSFVRAQWAGRPFAWQIYPQQDEIHWVKLNAFLSVYIAGLPPSASAAVTELWHAWNRQTGVAKAWQDCSAHWAALGGHAETWADTLARRPDLASSLVQFCEKTL
jgi:uncharacterized repeat protein (TIGR03837 family)